VEKVLISACLLGERVRYHGGDARREHPAIDRWQAEGRLVPLCPEVTGGLSTPRPAAEIMVTPEGRRVLTAAGTDVTGAFERGAEAAARTCAAHGIRVAILKDGSPSCGRTYIHNGQFKGTKKRGEVGVTAALLQRHGIAVFNEHQIAEAEKKLKSLSSLLRMGA